MSGNRTGFDDADGNDLRDPALRRALDHAPDGDALPEAHTRDAILKMAHNLAAQPASTSAASASAAGAANSASALPWWRRLFGGGGESRSRMPWNAAFATVLVAAFVTVLWRSEPVPEARLDGEARVGGAAAPPAEAPAAPAPAAVVAPEAEAEAARKAAPPPPVVAEQAPAGSAPVPASPAPSTARAPVPPPAAAPAPQAPAPAADQRAKVLRESSSAKESARAPALPKQAAPSLAAPPPPPVVAAQAEPAPAQDERREERVESERRRAYASAVPTAPSVPAAPATPAPSAPSAESAVPAAPVLRAAPLARRAPDTASALASRGDAQAGVSGALRDASPNALAKARPQAAAPSFSALERWTSFSLGTGNARRARSDVEGLPALLSAVARSASVADAALDAPVEARVALYRGNARVAVLEIAGDQVRWTPQPGGTAWVGTPPAQALDALRSALTR
jgi:hypothetical protein